jgi:hypothetical protein
MIEAESISHKKEGAYLHSQPTFSQESVNKKLGDGKVSAKYFRRESWLIDLDKYIFYAIVHLLAELMNK